MMLLSFQGPSFQHGDVIVSGFMTVVKQLIQFATNFVEEAKTLIGSTSLENAEIQQWMSYCETHIKPVLDDVQGMNTRAEVITNSVHRIELQKSIYESFHLSLVKEN